MTSTAKKKEARRREEYVKAPSYKRGDTRAQTRKRIITKSARNKKLNTQGKTFANIESKYEANNRKEHAKDATPKQIKKYNRRSLEKRHISNKVTKANDAEMDREFAKRKLSRSKNQRADRVIEGEKESWLVKRRVERHSETLKDAKKAEANAKKGIEEVKTRRTKINKQTNLYAKRKKKALPRRKARIKLSKSRRGMIGQPIGGGRRNPNLKK